MTWDAEGDLEPLEVVTPESVGAAIEAVQDDLNELRGELNALRAEAESLEMDLEQARALADGEAAVASLAELLEEMVSATKQELRATLEKEKREAAARVVSGSADVDRRPNRVTRVSGVELGGDLLRHRIRPGATVPGSRSLRLSVDRARDHGSGHSEDDGVRPVWSPRPNQATESRENRADAGETWGPDVAVVASDAAEVGHPSQALTSVETMSAGPVGPEGEVFRRFWGGDPSVQPAPRKNRGRKLGVLDAILPMISATLVILVVLSWVG